ncbi:MAG: BON domain-containing protein [Acidobacteriota bacterium]
MKSTLLTVALVACVLPASVFAQSKGTRGNAQNAQARLEREVRHELVMLSQYGVFDNLAYQVTGSTVTLIGNVTRPVLKSNAEKAVKDIEGVERVENKIIVLPVFSADNQIRIAVYQAIYGSPALQRYAMQAIPSIHIIVNNGNVTLEGAVANKSDGDMANIRAKTVSGVFSVTNNLKTDAQLAEMGK